jgi:hypothetical protein
MAHAVLVLADRKAQQGSRSQLPVDNAIPYIHVGADSGELWALDGQPVWPVATQSQFLALQAMVHTMGGSARESRGSKQSLIGGAEVVAALGDIVADEARLYAHLTRRDTVVVGGAEQAASTDRLAVLIALEADLDYDLVAALYDREGDIGAPGIVYAPTIARLREQVLVRTAAAHLCCPLARRRIDLFPRLAFDRINIGADWVLLGRHATAASMRSALGSNAGLLHLQTTSDGLDALLRPDLVLCAVHDAVPDAPVRTRPVCMLTGFCHRTLQSVKSAAESDKLLAPEAIAARVFVLDACWGWRPPLRVSDPAWGFTERLLQSFRTGVLLTPWEITLSAPYISAELIGSLAAGESAGTALATHIHRWKNTNGHRMCLIGDPRVRLPKPGAGSGVHPILYEEGVDVSRSATITRSLAFLRAYVTAARRVGHVYEDLSEDVMTALVECEDAVLDLRSLEEGEAAVGPRLRRALLRFLAGRWSVSARTWAPWVAEQRNTGVAIPCWVCGVEARRFESRLWIAGQPERIVLACPNCGHVADLPKGVRLEFEVSSDGTFRLSGDTTAANAMFAIQSHRRQGERILPLDDGTDERDEDEPRLELAFPWPELDAGLAHEFKPLTTWPEGPLRVAVFVVWREFELGILSTQARGELFNRPARA